MEQVSCQYYWGYIEKLEECQVRKESGITTFYITGSNPHTHTPTAHKKMNILLFLGILSVPSGIYFARFSVDSSAVRLEPC